MEISRGETWQAGRRMALAGLGCLLFSTQLTAADYSYTRIRFPGAAETWATNINARGDVVGNYFTADGVRHGFLLRKGVYTTVEIPEVTSGLGARGINARGDIVGTFEDTEGNSHGFLLSDGQFTRIDRPGWSSTSSFGINNAGDVVGIGDGGGYLFRDGKFSKAPGGGVRGVGYNVMDVQDNGRVLVGVALDPSGIVAGFVSRRFGEIEIIAHPDLSVSCSGVRGINQRGDMVGFSVNLECDPPFGDSRGYLLRDGEVTPIEVPGGQGTEAWSINDDGVIVGRYLDRSGRIVGFRARPRN